DADVHVLGDVLPDHDLRRLVARRRGVDPALPRRRAVPGADHRHRGTRLRDLGGLPRRDGAAGPVGEPPPAHLAVAVQSPRSSGHDPSTPAQGTAPLDRRWSQGRFVSIFWYQTTSIHLSNL